MAEYAKQIKFPVNREERRKCQSEYDKIQEKLLPIEIQFRNGLFQENTFWNVTYNRLYNSYHPTFQNVLTYLKCWQFEYWELNDFYFQETYKSVI